MSFTYRYPFEEPSTRSLQIIMRSLPEIKPPKSLLKPKKPWEHLNKTAYKSNKR